MTNEITPELLNISYDEINEVPALCINNDLSIIITNMTFVKSFISAYDEGHYFRYSKMRCSKLYFKPHFTTEDAIRKKILSLDTVMTNKDYGPICVYTGKGDFVGLANPSEIHDVFIKIKEQLKEIR